MYSAASIIENLKSAASLECEGLDSIQCPNPLLEIECPVTLYTDFARGSLLANKTGNVRIT